MPDESIDRLFAANRFIRLTAIVAADGGSVERGDILEAVSSSTSAKLTSENEIAEVSRRDSRRTLIGRKLLV